MFKGKEMEIQLLFEKPLYVSYSDIADVLEITVTDNAKFAVAGGSYLKIANATVIQESIPL